MQYHPRLLNRTIFTRPRGAVYPHGFAYKPRNEIPSERPKPAVAPTTPSALGNHWYWLNQWNPDCTAYTNAVWTTDTAVTMTRPPSEPAVTGSR